MELCSLTLKEYISQRNSKPLKDDEDMFSCVDAELNATVVRQLLEALAHVHSKGLIHRDVKPGNVFLRLPANDVVLGDFGLACADDSDLDDAAAQRHSSGVGTWTYSAPEQLNSTKYDHKVDMFSLGMIAYELYYPFRTTSERFSSRMELRRGVLAPSFVSRWPAEAGMIGRLLCPSPEGRPSAAQLLRDSFLHPKDTRIQRLETELEAAREEICNLKAEIERIKGLLPQESGV